MTENSDTGRLFKVRPTCNFCGQEFDGGTTELFCSAYCKAQVGEIVANHIPTLSEKSLWVLVRRYKLTRAISKKYVVPPYHKEWLSREVADHVPTISDKALWTLVERYRLTRTVNRIYNERG